MKLPFYIALFILTMGCSIASAQNSGAELNNKKAAITNTKGNGASVTKDAAVVKGNNGGGSKIDNKGAAVKNKNGGGVSAQKGKVEAKSSTGKGVQVDKKGLDVKGKNGGLDIEKGKFQIKSKKVNVKLGK